MLQATHYTRRGARTQGLSYDGVLALGEDSFVDKIKNFFTSSSASAPAPQPPSGVCTTGTSPDPATGAALDPASGFCVCPFGTQWDDPSRQCVTTTASDTPTTSNASETTGSSTLRDCLRTGFGVAFCVKNHPEITRDDIQIVFPALTSGDIDSLLAAVTSAQAAPPGASAADIARICIRGAGSFASCTAGLSTTDIDQLAKEFPQQAAVSKPVVASVAKKKFFDLKNPMFWVAAVAGAAVVIGGGYLVFRRKPAAAPAASATLPTARTA